MSRYGSGVKLPSAKSTRVSLRKRDRNLPLRSRAKTFISQARSAMDSGDLEQAERHTRSAVVALDKAASKGALHPNNAARRKSRLMRQLSEAQRG